MKICQNCGEEMSSNCIKYCSNKCAYEVINNKRKLNYMENKIENPGVENKYIAPKNWAEISDSEKIERIREVVKGLERVVGNLRMENNRLFTILEKHSHSDGIIKIPFNRYDGNSPVCGETNSLRSNGGGVYF